MKTNTKYLNKYLIRYRKPFFMALTVLILETLGDLIQPIIMSKIIDNGVRNGDINYVLKLGGLMLLLTFIGLLLATTRNLISTKASQGFGADLREDLYTKIQGFSLDNVNEFQDASLITRLTNDVNHMQNFSHGMMRVFVKAPVMGIGAIIMSFILNTKMGFILLSLVPIVGIITYFNFKLSYPLFKRMQKALDKVNGTMGEYLAGIRVVKAFNRFDYEEERFGEVNENLKNTTVKGMKTIAIFSPLISLCVNMGVVLVLWFGGYSVNGGNMEAGKIMALINYLTQLLFALVMMSRILNMFIRAKASAERVGEVFIAENTIIEVDNPISNVELKENIEFENVYFQYKGHCQPILEDINFSIKSGEILGIIGSTGSGKSTLINLISRFYDPLEGSIKIDGVDIRDIKIEKLRDKIAMVPQKVLLFTGTILENIKWGNEDATTEEVVQVAKIAQAHDFITSFNEGYNTYLGQGGVNLSGGQKQRVSIARALIKRPDILILDDSTSAVDMITERKIKDGLRKYSKDTTVILIAQRITSIMDADKILVMDKGKIVDQGNHMELMKTSEIYQDIYHSQIGKEDIAIGF
ncbi:MAG: ABC transporter ATP-binding protein [Tissierellia bacterium]|nr:ABC transporter ATP-binding protein [Tissierellia bacterium]